MEWETKSQDYNRQRTMFLTELLTNGGYLNKIGQKMAKHPRVNTPVPV